ncbi:unnamed protein product, partial [Meganyctiphanes norvegica]
EYCKVRISEISFLEHDSNALLKGMKQELQECKEPINAITTHSSNIMEKMVELNTNRMEYENILLEKMVKMNNKRMESENVLVNSVLMLKEGVDGCPGGFFLSTQCFTIFRDQPSNWTDAVKRCQSKGLVLAEPSDTVAVPLRRFLLERYGDGSFWVNARGNQRKIMWQRGNKALEDDSPLWSGQPEYRVTPAYCLSLLSWY